MRFQMQGDKYHKKASKAQKNQSSPLEPLITKRAEVMATEQAFEVPFTWLYLAYISRMLPNQYSR